MQVPDLGRARAELTAHILFSMRTAVEAVGHNTLRAALTSLGILFGVASVIAMLAIGKGAEQEILEQMKLLGSNNVIVTPLVEQKEEKAKDEGTKEPKRFSPGLTRHDAAAVLAIVPNVNTVSGEIVLQTLVTREGRRRSGKVVGIDTTYFDILNLNVAEGKRFAAMQVADGAPVAIIGHGVKTRFFTTEEPIGKSIKVGNVWLTVVGVLEDRKVSSQTAQKLGIRDANMDVYVPLSTMLLRYRNRAQVTERDVQQASREFNEDPNATANEDTEQRAERINYHQLDRVIVRVNDAKYVTGVADVMQRMLTRRHNQVIDFEIAVPELLLKQEQNTKRLFNIVLAAIAAISLVVGGIGIMNIMLVSVTERTREIGVRKALGATRNNILSQFLIEAIVLCILGGIVGIVLGSGTAYMLQRSFQWNTEISSSAVVMAFLFSAAVGVVFGVWPARRAAMLDPIQALRYE